MKAGLRIAVLVALSPAAVSSGHAQNNQALTVHEEAGGEFDSPFGIDDRDPEKSIPSEAERNKHPVDFGAYLMVLSDKAEAAFKRGDSPAAARFYQAMAKAVPDAAVSLIKLCAVYEAAGERAKAEQSCGDALTRSGVGVEDFVHYVRLVLAQSTPLTTEQLKRVDAVVAHLKAQAGSLTVSSELACDIGIRLDDVKRLARCSSELHKSAPKSLKTVSYEWAYALRRLDFAAAGRLIGRAKQLGMKPDALARMEELTRAAKPSPWDALHRKPLSTLLAAAGVTGLLVLVGFAALRKRRSTLRQVSV